jgi:hypothetical protein
LISVSPFHAETTPLKRTLLAIQQAFMVFSQERVIVYQPEWVELIARLGIEEPLPLESYAQVYGVEGMGELFWDGYGLISGGRAGYCLGHLTHRRPPLAFRREDCLHEILYTHHSHFDLYGNYISAFCGGLAVGSWRDLPQLLVDYAAGRYPSLIGLLIAEGPYGLFELACSSYDYAPLDEGYAGKCHLCVDVRRHLAQAGDFPELRPLEFYNRF